VKKNNISSKT